MTHPIHAIATVHQPFFEGEGKKRLSSVKRPHTVQRNHRGLSANAQDDRHGAGVESLLYAIAEQGVRDYRAFEEIGLIRGGKFTGKWPQKQYNYTVRYQDGRTRKATMMKNARVMGMDEEIDVLGVISFFKDGGFERLMRVVGYEGDADVLVERVLSRKRRKKGAK